MIRILLFIIMILLGFILGRMLIQWSNKFIEADQKSEGGAL